MKQRAQRKKYSIDTSVPLVRGGFQRQHEPDVDMGTDKDGFTNVQHKVKKPQRTRTPTEPFKPE